MSAPTPMIDPMRQRIIDYERTARQTTGKPYGPVAAFPGGDWRHGDFSDTAWTGEDFTRADLRGADFHGCTFRDADLTGARLYDADFTDADLREARGLLAGQFAGANLTRAQLPADAAQFPALEQVKELSQSSARLFLVILGFGTFLLLSIATAHDRDLILNQRGTKLPIIDVEIPLLSFYLVAPILLLLVYIYFHLYLGRLWITMSHLPAIFPDGRSLRATSYPWLVNELCLRHLTYPKVRPSPVRWLENVTVRLLVWWVAPFLMWLIWAQSLRAQSIGLTRVHLAVFFLGLIAALWFQQQMGDTFRRRRATWDATFDRHRLRRFRWSLIGSCVVLIFLSLWTHSIFSTEKMDPFSDVGYFLDARETREPPPPSRFSLREHLARFTVPSDPSTGQPDFLLWPQWGPRWMGNIAIVPFARASYEQFSTVPPNWTGGDDLKTNEVALVRGVRISDQLLRRANLHGAFFARSVFTHCRVEGATFDHADLRDAMFDHLWAQDADFTSARFSTRLSPLEEGEKVDPTGQAGKGQDRAYFDGGWFAGADFEYARLEGVVFCRVDLRGACFDHAKLAGARFEGCDLSGAYFTDADLTEACFVPYRLDSEKKPGVGGIGEDLPFDGYFECKKFNNPCVFGKTHFSKCSLPRTVFEYCDLTSATFSYAELEGTVLGSTTGLKLEQLQDAWIAAPAAYPSEWTWRNQEWIKALKEKGARREKEDISLIFHNLSKSGIKKWTLPDGPLRKSDMIIMPNSTPAPTTPGK